MRLRSSKGCRIAEKSIHRYVLPLQDFQGIQVIDNGKSIELVQARYRPSVLDISQAADVHRELRARVCPGKRKAGLLDVAVCQPVCQPETFADLAETKSRIHID